jgi:hypothetical protein
MTAAGEQPATKGQPFIMPGPILLVHCCKKCYPRISAKKLEFDVKEKPMAKDKGNGKDKKKKKKGKKKGK